MTLLSQDMYSPCPDGVYNFNVQLTVYIFNIVILLRVMEVEISHSDHFREFL
jgi:hypothetical protein